MTEFYIPYPLITSPPRAKRKRTLSNTYGLNAYYAGKHYMVRKQDADFWHMWTLSALNKQRIPRRIYPNPVEITFSWDDGLDCSNHAVMGKMIEDALIGYLIAGDGRKCVVRIVHEFNRDKKIIVKVREITDA